MLDLCPRTHACCSHVRLPAAPSSQHPLTLWTESCHNPAGWWFKPDFIINELNINSAVSRPWHDEVLPLGTNSVYNMNGYSYTGVCDHMHGGMRVHGCAGGRSHHHQQQQLHTRAAQRRQATAIAAVSTPASRRADGTPPRPRPPLPLMGFPPVLFRPLFTAPSTVPHSPASVFVYVHAALLIAGGGRKIIRVEVSLDGGHLWRQAEITRHETPTPAGEQQQGTHT